MRKPRQPLSAAKAKKILSDRKVKGKKLTERQRKFMGLIASGKTPKRLGEVSQADRKRLKFS